MSLSPDTRKRIEEIVAGDRVVLFMKGTRSFPQCGFSARVVQILDRCTPEYRTVDVLQDPEIREGVKEYSSWPTIPQLYVGGEFMGGCDIVTEMYQTGELQQVLGAGAAAAER
jgi:monothiol glutaredoxin